MVGIGVDIPGLSTRLSAELGLIQPISSGTWWVRVRGEEPVLFPHVNALGLGLGMGVGLGLGLGLEESSIRVRAGSGTSRARELI